MTWRQRDMVTLREHLEALNREADRRYSEVNVEREKALKIKEEADRRALELADSIQQYKDEKANELRSQIERERGSYATQADLKGLGEKLEALIKPLSEFVSAQQGRPAAGQTTGLTSDSRAGTRVPGRRRRTRVQEMKAGTGDNGGRVSRRVRLTLPPGVSRRVRLTLKPAGQRRTRPSTAGPRWRSA